MPRYDFICPACQVKFEAIVPSTQKQRACDACLINRDQLVMAERQLCFPASIHIH